MYIVRVDYNYIATLTFNNLLIPNLTYLLGIIQIKNYKKNNSLSFAIFSYTFLSSSF